MPNRIAQKRGKLWETSTVVYRPTKLVRRSRTIAPSKGVKTPNRPVDSQRLIQTRGMRRATSGVQRLGKSKRGAARAKRINS
jgi:hypothetical protein